jgi:tubulin delta
VLLLQAEACDFLEGFLLLQSMAGGTGAGLGTYVAELMADHFSAAHIVNACIW